MSKYYLLTGYLIGTFSGSVAHGQYMPNEPMDERIKYFEKKKNSLKNVTLVKLSSKLEVKIVYKNVDFGHFLIKSNKRRDAYKLANIIRGFLGVFYGNTPDDKNTYYFLQEINRLPNYKWTEIDLLNALKEINPWANDFILQEIFSGSGVYKEQLSELANFIEVTNQHSDIYEALNHLLESRFLFYGYMVGSYYHVHYARERKNTNRWEMEKRYLENRYRYESAFVAAFKGIERFFKKNHFVKADIESLFENNDVKNVEYSTKYKRYHEIFLGHRKYITYGDLIAHFLLIRNVVAAHGNKKPPKKFWISEDNLFEIQLFLSELILKAYQHYK